MTLAARRARFAEVDLYVVITERCCAGRPALAMLDAVLAAGVRAVQLREKELGDRALLARAHAFRRRTAAAGALFIMDDRVDLALAAGADGVHLGRTDLPLAVARRLAPELLLGASTHTPAEAVAAERAGASYVNVGPIFPTTTKPEAGPPLGPDAVTRTAPLLRVPFTVMGGIDVYNVDEVARRGARHVAVITAVTAAADPGAAARRLRAALQPGPPAGELSPGR